MARDSKVTDSSFDTGYGRFKGMRFDADHLEDIFSALDDNGLLKQSHLLTGYTPSAKALETVSRAVDRLKEINPDLVYVCDTVCGDDGRLYVRSKRSTQSATSKVLTRRTHRWPKKSSPSTNNLSPKLQSSHRTNSKLKSSLKPRLVPSLLSGQRLPPFTPSTICPPSSFLHSLCPERK